MSHFDPLDQNPERNPDSVHVYMVTNYLNPVAKYYVWLLYMKVVEESFLLIICMWPQDLAYHWLDL